MARSSSPGRFFTKVFKKAGSALKGLGRRKQPPTTPMPAALLPQLNLPAESDDPGVQALIDYYKNQRCPPDANGGMYVPGYGYFPQAGGDIIDSVLARQAEATAAAPQVQQHAADAEDLPPTMMMVPIGYCAGPHAAGLAVQRPAAQQQVQLLPLPPGLYKVSEGGVIEPLRRRTGSGRRDDSPGRRL